jgi:hypothetical protein
VQCAAVSEFYHEFKGGKREERARYEFVLFSTKRRYQIKVQFFLRISIKTNVVLYTVSTLQKKEFAQTPLSFSFSLSFCSPAELGTRCC